MANLRTHRLPALLVAGAAASALMAAPALASEGPAAPPPGPLLPSGIAPPTLAPLPSTIAPSVRSKAPRVVRRARLVHTRVKQGRRARLRVSLNTPSRLRIVLRRASNGHRIRVMNVNAGGLTVSRRLPARSGGHVLRVGRYRVSVVSIDANGTRSRPINLSMIVHR